MPALPDAYLGGVEASGFDWREYLRTRYVLPELSGEPTHRELVLRARLRRILTERDPLLFALVYLPHLLASRETGGQVSFADFHLDLCRDALARHLAEPLVGAPKFAYIAPRGMGKSTWLFIILPLWALAHRHRRFMVALGETAEVARKHMMTLRLEVETNELLRRDFPYLCTPARNNAGHAVADTQSLYVSAPHKDDKKSTIIMARGIDSTVLGAAYAGQRPDMIVFDDIEPDEGNYSAEQKATRLKTVQGAVFPMSPAATVTFVGTVTMAGSIMHDVVRHATEPKAEDLASWVVEANIAPRYYPLLETAEGGEVRSTWERKYPTEWCLAPLGSIRRCDTSDFQLAYMNDARGRDGGYWTSDDFVYEEPDESFTRWILEIDPAVTNKVTSDWTGMAVVAAQPPGRPTQKACVVDSWQVRMTGRKLRDRVLKILERYPRIRAVRVEVNNGGEYIPEALAGLPVKVLTHTSTVSKDVRMAWALDHYQTRRVTHAQRQRALEDEMISYPKGKFDDVADAACSGVLYHLSRPTKLAVSTRSESYV